MYRVLREPAGAGIFAEDRGRLGLTPLAAPLRTGAPAFDQIFGTSLFDDYAARHDAARVGAEG